MKELPQDGESNASFSISKEETSMGNEPVLAYRRYILGRIISSPEEDWQKQARRYFLEVVEFITDTYATGSWLDSMIELENDLARMGGVVKDKI